MVVHIGNDWDQLLEDQWTQPYYQELRRLLWKEYKSYEVYPPADQLFNALKRTSYRDCKVLILGQDPYHEKGQANGLSFSVNPGVPLPPSLVNIYQELEDDLGCSMPSHGDLGYRADQGVMLLNASLSVRAHAANSHAKIGWSLLTDRIVSLLGQREDPLVFLLWGNFARSKKTYVVNSDSLVLESAHPSPLSAYRGFFGSRPFSKINQFLLEHKKEPIDWQIPEKEAGCARS